MIKNNRAMLVLALSAAFVGAAVLPANAAPAAVSVTPAGALARDAASVTVSVSNVPAGQGIYLMYCATPAAGARPTACFGRGVWASSDSKMTAQGAVALDAPLTLPVAIQFTPQGGAAVDCEKVGCGIFVRRDHLGGTDLSLDSFTPVTFVPLVQQKVEVTAEAGRVLFTVAGFKGKTVEVNFGGRIISHAIATDAAKFYVGNAKGKAVVVSVMADQSQVFQSTVRLLKK